MASGIVFLQKKVFDLLYKIAGIPVLEPYKPKILVSLPTCSTEIQFMYSSFE